MKRGRRLTRNEKEIVASQGLNPKDWMLAEEYNFYIKIIHKGTQKTRIIDKFIRGKKH